MLHVLMLTSQAVLACASQRYRLALAILGWTMLRGVRHRAYGLIEPHTGPHGTLTFKQRRPESAALVATSALRGVYCESFGRIEDGACADTSVPNRQGCAPHSTFVSAGGLSAGRDSEACFAVLDGRAADIQRVT